MSRVLSLLFLLAFLLAACNTQSGPKQTLVFKAVPLPGTKSIDLAETKRIISGRLRAAELKCRFQVKELGLSQLEVITFGADEGDLEKIKEYVTANATLEFAPIAHAILDDELVAAAKDVVGEVKVADVVRGAWLPEANPDSNDMDYLEASVDPAVVRQREVDGKTQREWLVAYDPECRVTGDQLSNASATLDSTSGPAIAFVIRDDEVWRMQHMTTQLRPSGNRYRQLSIIWNGAIVSAPRVQSQIGKHGQITGNFTDYEVKTMAALLRSGQLPCVLEFAKVTTEGK